MELLFFILVCFGMTKVLVWGSIFNKIRPDKPPFNCAMCMGWYVGVLVYFLIIGTSLKYAFLYGCLSSGTSYCLDNLIDDEGLRIEWKK